MTNSTPRKTEIYVSSGQVLSGQKFANTYVIVEQGGVIADDSVGTGAVAEISNGGSAVSISVSYGGYLEGSGGSVLSNDVIYNGGYQTEGSEDYSALIASATDTLVLSGGVDDVESYAVSISATIDAGGFQNVFGGVATATLVESGGEAAVNFGSAANVVIDSGGQLEIQDEGSAGGVVMAGGVAVVQPDYYDPLTLSGLKIASGGSLVLIGGATEQGATIAAGGTLERASVAVYQDVGAAVLLISAADTLTTSLGFGMSADVYSGGVLSAAVLTSGGVATILSGGLAIDAVIQSGGDLTFDQYGGSSGQLPAAIDPAVYNGGTLVVTGGNVTGAIIHSGGYAIVSGIYGAAEKGLVDTDVLAGGLVRVGEQGIANRVQLEPGGVLQLQAGTLSNTVVSAGAALVVLGGTVNNTVVGRGGQITVVGRGNDTFNGGIIEAGGTLTFVSGYAGHGFSNFVLESGATLVEIAGGTEYGLTIKPGAHVISGNVGLFQTAPSSSDYPAQTVERLLAVGNTLSHVTVAASEYLEVAIGGSVSGLTVQALGTANVYGGTVSGGVVSGYLTVDEGSATGFTIGGGGNILVYYGTAQDVTISQGGTETTEYATLMDTTISMGGEQIDYASAVDTTVLNGGLQYIDGGIANDTTIAAGGTAQLVKGSLIDTFITVGGTIELDDEPYVTGATVSLNSATDVLTITQGGGRPETYTLQLTGNYTGETFHVAANKLGNTMVTLSAAGAARQDPGLAREMAPGGYAAPDSFMTMRPAASVPLLAGSASAAAPESQAAVFHVMPHPF